MGCESTVRCSRLLVVESWMKGVQHLTVNVSVIKILQKNFPSHETHMFAEKGHLDAIKSKLPHLHAHKIILPHYSVFLLPFFDLWSVFPTLRVLLCSKKGDIIVLTNRLPLAHLLFNIVNCYIRRPSIILMHGEMEVIVNPQNVGKTRFYFFLNKYAIRMAKSQTKYLIFGEPIKRKIQNAITLDESKILCIDHPICEIETIVPQSNHPIRVAFVGRAIRQKRAQLIFELASALEKEIAEGTVCLEIIGTIDPAILPQVGNEKVLFSQSGDMLSTELFTSKIGKTHFFVCFLDDKSYQAIPSGTFMDVLMYEKPILSLAGNSFVEHYFSRFPHIGQRCATVEKMADYIKSCLTDSFQERYEAYVEHIKEAKKEFIPNHLSKTLEEQLLQHPFDMCL